MSEGTNAKVRRRRKALIVRSGIAIVVIAALAGLYFLLRNTTLPVIGKHPCETKQLIAEYNTAFSDKGGKEKADAVIKKVKQSSKPEENATCTYMMLRYEATYGLLTEAKKQLTTLKSLEESKKSISKDINDGANKEELYKSIDLVNEKPSPEQNGVQRVDG